MYFSMAEMSVAEMSIGRNVRGLAEMSWPKRPWPKCPSTLKILPSRVIVLVLRMFCFLFFKLKEHTSLHVHKNCCEPEILKWVVFWG